MYQSPIGKPSLRVGLLMGLLIGPSRCYWQPVEVKLG